jgi:hypothetical protein
MTFDRSTNKLTLVDIAPMTIFFTDSPERLAGAVLGTLVQGRQRLEQSPITIPTPPPPIITRMPRRLSPMYPPPCAYDPFPPCF